MTVARTAQPLALTAGEPAGVAPEISSLAWQELRESGPTFFAICDADLLARRSSHVDTVVKFEKIGRADEAPSCFNHALPVLHIPLPQPARPGQPDPANASYVLKSIDTAVQLALSGDVAGVVTNPIQKSTLYTAGFRHEGHTDYLGELARSAGRNCSPVMMLQADDLRTVPITVHVPIKAVPMSLTRDLIVKQTLVTARDLAKWFGISRARIAVTGLNPHAGEGGAIGTEEVEVIAPAIASLRAEGLDVSGPLPADTVFHETARRSYDLVVCMYHDQALIPIKTLDFAGGVNITLGLPFIRTSPDHGTALSHAGTGTASASSLIAALRLAAEMASRS